ncbi:DUF2312 domain-containing protein [Thalassobaculum sp. OXR-137]|uniref:DUF2312 domain-containing protein n=1 Tax=Thalassobaculum sp. OXR-137 TaxID=3100173 RepID=UPI002AC9CBDD|nr:DUF2312 domain-containing protein [Thalassobaculum sp. OXR-137]WPZ35226.1 DUF2312 domain-containing protein [Thalassobaculum sp. OXR-137]
MSDDYDDETAPAPASNNSGIASASEKDSPYIGGINAGQLESFIQRIENLEEEKANLAADIREIFAEAKAQGYDVKIMRQILKLRKMEEDDRDELETLLEVYKRALGMA